MLVVTDTGAFIFSRIMTPFGTWNKNILSLLSYPSLILISAYESVCNIASGFDGDLCSGIIATGRY